jgi:hypothetical protein
MGAVTLALAHASRQGRQRARNASPEPTAARAVRAVLLPSLCRLPRVLCHHWYEGTQLELIVELGW